MGTGAASFLAMLAIPPTVVTDALPPVVAIILL
jgi:hypothetical protein